MDLPKTYVFTHLLVANSVQLDLRQFIEDTTDFILKAVSATSPHNYFVRLQFPNGRYHSNARVHANVYLAIAGQRLILEPVVKCPPGTFLGVELENQTGAAVAVVLTFEGVKRVYLK